MEKKIIKEMLIETRFLKQGVYEQENPYLQELFDELEIIFAHRTLSRVNRG